MLPQRDMATTTAAAVGVSSTLRGSLHGADVRVARAAYLQYGAVLTWRTNCMTQSSLECA